MRANSGQNVTHDIIKRGSKLNFGTSYMYIFPPRIGYIPVPCNNMK